LCYSLSTNAIRCRTSAPLPIPKDSALASAGAEICLTPRLAMLVKFDGKFAPGSQTYGGSGTLRYIW
jgi:uncharacterized protein with beta-barrel porin domain